MVTDILATATWMSSCWYVEFTLGESELGLEVPRLDQVEAEVRRMAAPLLAQDADITVEVAVNVAASQQQLLDYNDALERLQQAQLDVENCTDDAVLSLYDAGMTMREVGMLLGIGTQRVSQCVHKRSQQGH